MGTDRRGEAARKPGARKRDAQGFTDLERAFVLHYIGAANRVAITAYEMAGYKSHSRHAGRKYASEVRNRPHVSAEIDRLTEERSIRLQITADDVLRDLAQIKVEAELLPKNVQVLRVRREILKDIGDHIAVGAFRRQVGVSSPTGGPIEVIDASWLAKATDDELAILERAREIVERLRRASAPDADRVGDPDGEGAPPQGE